MTFSAATSTVQTLLAFDFGQKRIGVAVGRKMGVSVSRRFCSWVPTERVVAGAASHSARA